MGDGMMATFGIPEVAEDDAAPRGARGRRDAATVPRVRRRHRSAATARRSRSRVGINTGEVVIADGRRRPGRRRAQRRGPPREGVPSRARARRRGDLAADPRRLRLRAARRGRPSPVAPSRSAIYEVAAETEREPEPVARRSSAATTRCRGCSGASTTRAPTRSGAARDRARLAGRRQDPPLARAVARGSPPTRGARAFEIRCDRAGDATFAPDRAS